jgi:steroid 5-alpha reductase family enzyme
VFALQGILMWIITIPLLQAQFHARPSKLTLLDYAAVGLWIVGFFFEAAGDAQMARFKSNHANKGKVLTTGVWRFTRHPNYFGEAVQWWAYFLFALLTPFGIAVIYAPILMTYLLVNVSGVALLEKTLKDVKPQYKDYIETTSAFVPWFPKQRAE